MTKPGRAVDLEDMHTIPRDGDRCIYCGKRGPLSREHIIPLALNGTAVLQNASCSDCAKLTSADELVVTRQMYGDYRAKIGARTRRRSRRPESIKITTIDSQGVHQVHTLPIADAPSWHIAYKFPPPGILSGAPLSSGTPPIEATLCIDVHAFQNTAQSLSAEKLVVGGHLYWQPFCRMLAKIAHAYLVVAVGDAGYTPLLPDLILRKSDYLSHLIGSFAEPPDDLHDSDLGIEVFDINGEPYLSVVIRLLRGSYMHSYQVVAAKVIDMDAILRAADRHTARGARRVC